MIKGTFNSAEKDKKKQRGDDMRGSLDVLLQKSLTSIQTSHLLPQIISKCI